jgi:Cu+-exporting ATPase
MAPIQIFVDGIATPLHGATLRTSLLQTVGVHSAQVDQTLTSVIVSLDESVLSLSQLRDKIVSCGFKINSHNLEDTQIVNLKIKFMTCNSCVTTITDVLMSTQGVLNAHIDLDSETGRVTVVGISPEEVANVIEDCGFEASVLDEHHRSNDDNDKSLTKRAKVGPQNPFINQGINKPETFSFELKRFKKNSTFNVIPSSKTSTFHITGMTCGSCVSTIEKHLNSRREIVIASVNLTIDQATVEYIETLISEREIIELIDDIGFEAELIELSKYGEIDLQIFGMTCASCSGKIERELGKLNGVESITVNLLGQSAHICFNEAIGVRGLIEKIESLGFNALIKDDSAATQSAALSRTMDILQWRRSFMLSLLFSIPVMIIAMVLPKLWPSFPKIIVIFPGLLLGQLLQMVLTAPLQFGIGWRFYVAAYKSLSHGSYTMDVLVTLGTSLSYGFSVFSMIHSTIRKGKPPAEIFFSTSAMLITFITFGR